MGLKYQVNENFFDTLNADSAYLLGYIYADGSLEDAPYIRGKYIRVNSIDKELISTTRKLLNSKHKIVLIPPYNDYRQVKFQLRIGSHKLYDSLFKLGLRPNKSLTMSFPLLDKKLLPHFIRGYFDGDGSVRVEYALGAKNQRILKRLRVVFTCGSYEFLKYLSEYLKKTLDLKLTHLYKGHRSFQLSYSTSDGIKLFKYIYTDESDYFLKRKFNIFLGFLKRYEKWRDDDIIKILKTFGHVVK